MHVLTLHSAHTGRSIFSASTEPPTHTYAYMRKSSVKHLDHLKCSRLVLWFQGQTTLTSPSTASNEESVLRTPWLLAFTSPSTPHSNCVRAFVELPKDLNYGIDLVYNVHRKQTNTNKKTLNTEQNIPNGCQLSHSSVWFTGQLHVHWAKQGGCLLQLQCWLSGKLQC